MIYSKTYQKIWRTIMTTVQQQTNRMSIRELLPLITNSSDSEFLSERMNTVSAALEALETKCDGKWELNSVLQHKTLQAVLLALEEAEELYWLKVRDELEEIGLITVHRETV